jgi:hypothetical protein
MIVVSIIKVLQLKMSSINKMENFINSKTPDEKFVCLGQSAKQGSWQGPGAKPFKPTANDRKITELIAKSHQESQPMENTSSEQQ